MILLLTALTHAGAALLSACAGFIGTYSMAGLITIESQWHQFALADVDARTAYCVPWGRIRSCTEPQAHRILDALLAEGHSVSAGYAQINTVNWAHYHLNARNVFEPCRNVNIGARILLKDYDVALLSFTPGDPALLQSYSMYNSGRFFAALGYARDVYNAALAVQLPPAPALHAVPKPLSRTAFSAADLFLQRRARTQTPLYRTFLPVRSTTDRRTQ